MQFNGTANEDSSENKPKIFIFTREEVASLIEKSEQEFYLDENANTQEKLEDGIITYSLFNSLSEDMQSTIRGRFDILSNLLGIEFRNLDFEKSEQYPELKVKNFSTTEYIRDRTLTGGEERTIGQADSTFTIKLNKWDYENEDIFNPDTQLATTTNHEFFHLLGLGHTDNMGSLISEMTDKFHLSSMKSSQNIFDPQIGVLDIFMLEKELNTQTNYTNYFSDQSNYSQFEEMDENGKKIININFNASTFARDFVIIEMPRNGDIAIVSEMGEVVIPGVLNGDYDGVKFTFINGPISDTSLSPQDYIPLEKIVESSVVWKSGNSLTMQDVAISINDAIFTAQQNVPWFTLVQNVYPSQDYSTEMMSHIFSPNTSALPQSQLLEADQTKFASQNEIYMNGHKAARNRFSF